MLPLLPAYDHGELLSYKAVGEHPDLPCYLVKVVNTNPADYSEYAVAKLHGADADVPFWTSLSNLGPRQRLPLTRDNIIQALRIATDGKPADYRYTDDMRLQLKGWDYWTDRADSWESGKGGSCMYFDPRVKDGESCMCLVGTALHVLGYGPQDVLERQSASNVAGKIVTGLDPDLWQIGLTEYDRNTIRGLDEVQSCQDRGGTWPEAFRRYSRFIEQKQLSGCDRTDVMR